MGSGSPHSQKLCFKPSELVWGLTPLVGYTTVDAIFHSTIRLVEGSRMP